MNELEEATLRTIVEKAGGKWVGIQDRSILNQEPLVLFNNPQGSTLALPVSQLTEESVRKRITEKAKQVS